MLTLQLRTQINLHLESVKSSLMLNQKEKKELRSSFIPQG